MTMRTMHSVVKRGALYWDRALLPMEAYRARLARLQAEIVAAGDDAWLMMGDVERHGPVVYATNFMPRVRSALAFVPREGEPILLANISTRDIPAARTITFVEDIRAFGKISKDLLTLLEERAGQGVRIGTCGVSAAMPFPEWKIIAQTRPDIIWSERDAQLARLRAHKDAQETAAVRRAAAIAQAALDKAGDSLRAGASLRAAAADIERLCRAQGAEDARLLVACGEQAGRALRPPYDQTLANGDIVLVFLAVQNQRYWAEAARTFSIGPARADSQALYARCADALDAMRAACKAGAPARDLAATGQAVLGDLAASATLYGLGGAIGLDHEEGARLTPTSTARLNAGETLALRVIAHDGRAGAALAQTVQVGETGVEPLMNVPASLIAL
jgi:Xaa-Pro aminopeptidase